MERDAVALTTREWTMICEELSIDHETANVDLIVSKIGALRDALRMVRQQRDQLQVLPRRELGTKTKTFAGSAFKAEEAGGE